MICIWTIRMTDRARTTPPTSIRYSSNTHFVFRKSSGWNISLSFYTHMHHHPFVLAHTRIVQQTATFGEGHSTFTHITHFCSISIVRFGGGLSRPDSSFSLSRPLVGWLVGGQKAKASRTQRGEGRKEGSNALISTNIQRLIDRRRCTQPGNGGFSRRCLFRSSGSLSLLLLQGQGLGAPTTRRRTSACNLRTLFFGRKKIPLRC